MKRVLGEGPAGHGEIEVERRALRGGAEHAVPAVEAREELLPPAPDHVGVRAEVEAVAVPVHVRREHGEVIQVQLGVLGHARVDGQPLARSVVDGGVGQGLDVAKQEQFPNYGLEWGETAAAESAACSAYSHFWYCPDRLARGLRPC